ncbi:MAG: DNA-processing protein DprA, partial [Bacteroidetes bacterium]|nr:DNA-processing protein DprA [Bacteroidota bacterium]
ALDAGGTTWAVLGTGIDKCYPLEHARMAEAIRAQGMLLSEWLPGAGPEAFRFPLRNRVISGLAHVVIVVEAGIRSGALRTAGNALQQGREVFLVPGRPEDDASAGTNAFLSEGNGHILTDLGAVWACLDALKLDCRDDPGWEGIREAMRLLPPATAKKESKRPPTDAMKRKIQKILKHGPRHPASLLRDLGCSREELDVALFDLEMGGRVETLTGHRVSWKP